VNRRRSERSRVPIAGAVGSSVTLAVLCGGGVLMFANGPRAAGVVVLVLAGMGALYVVPFVLLVWLYRRS
jgi:hypothetical protein